MSAALYCDLGTTRYRPTYNLQQRLVERCRAGSDGTVLVTEHAPVYTLGRRGGREFLTVSEEFLAARGIEVVQIERGGVITYHGPGQLVVYPILHLKRYGFSVADYVHRLEEIMLGLAEVCGVSANRDSRNHGVWVADAKLGSVGIAIRHGVAFHGLAINVDPVFEHLAWLSPCGLTGVAMTSLNRESRREIAMTEVRAALPELLAEKLGLVLYEVEPASLTKEEVEEQ